MESTGIQRLFYFTWMVIKLNLYFLLFTLAGGVILGIGPAWQMLSDLVQDNRDYQKITIKRSWQLWRENFKTSNVHFWLFGSISVFVAYNLWLASQWTGLFWLCLDFFLLFFLVLLCIFYCYMVLYTSRYLISTVNLIKLSFISVFLDFKSCLKLLLGLSGLFLLSWQFKGLFLFATFALFMLWSAQATHKNRNFIDRKLAQDEAKR